MRTLFDVPLSSAPNVMSFENPPGAQTQSTNIDHVSMSVRPHARGVRTLQNRMETSACQERPRHCNLQYRWPEARVVVGETLTGGPARLSAQEREALGAYAARASWPAGFAIYQRGTAADGVFVVTRGRVVLRSRVRAGRGFVPWIATPGESFGSEGLAPNAKYATDARADDESETLFLSATRFRAFVREQPQHALVLVSQLMAERAALLDKLRELTTLSVEQRMVSTLLRMANNATFTREDGKIVLCTARYRLLCELVGATRESVSLVLSRLTGEGLVERKGSTLIIAPPTQLAERVDTSDSELLIATFADRAEQTFQ
jgi:CRP-like cAMP-binding protein